MRYRALVTLLWVGLVSPSLAYDIPPTPRTDVVESNPLKPAEAPTTIMQTGTVVGGGLLAAALIVGGLWLNRQRQQSKAN